METFYEKKKRKRKEREEKGKKYIYENIFAINLYVYIKSDVNYLISNPLLTLTIRTTP